MERELNRLFEKYILPDIDDLVELNGKNPPIKNMGNLFLKENVVTAVHFYDEILSYNRKKRGDLNAICGYVKKEDMKINVYFSFIIRGAKRTLKVGRVDMLYKLKVDEDFKDILAAECMKPNGNIELEFFWKEKFGL